MPTPISVADAIAGRARRRRPARRVKGSRVSDIDGVLRGKYLHKEKSFYGAAEKRLRLLRTWVLGVGHDGHHLRQHDAHRLAQRLSRCRPPSSTSAPCAPCRGTIMFPFFLGDFVGSKDGKEVPLPICPRQTLKRVLWRAR